MTRARPCRMIRGSTVGAAVIAMSVGILACSSSVSESSGIREWIIEVENMSDSLVRIVVAEYVAEMGAAVGTAKPSTVAPQTTTEVTLIVPPSQGNWAVFVTPSPRFGPVILARDVPGTAAGALPLTISIKADRSLTVSVPNEPGWFGQ